jgi:hypothetical protein
MQVVDSAERFLDHRVQDLRLMRNNTQELGLPTPVLSIEIAALQVLAGGVNLLKAITGKNEAEL